MLVCYLYQYHGSKINVCVYLSSGHQTIFGVYHALYTSTIYTDNATQHIFDDHNHVIMYLYLQGKLQQC